MEYLLRLEKENNISLPEAYKVFYRNCKSHIPEKLVGTDLLNNVPDLYIAAIDLLEENGVDNFLKEDDLVFMMHQGYMFWYFNANGDTDPIVYGYREGNLMPDKLEKFSDFIKEFL